MDRSATAAAAAADAKESIDNMGKEKEEGKESAFQKKKRKRECFWRSETESDEEEESEEESEEEEEYDEEDCGGHSEDDDPPPEDPILNLINDDDSDALMEGLKTSKDADGNYDFFQLQHAFQLACHSNKLGCLKALLDCGFDWFAEYAGSEERLLKPTCVADSKESAQLLIDYARKRGVLPKLLGAAGGMTPLHVAAICGSWKVIKLLLDEGADPCKPNAHHKLPSDRAHPGTKAHKLLVDAVMNKGIKYLSPPTLGTFRLLAADALYGPLSLK